MSLHPLTALPEHQLHIKRALLSVSDKTGITKLAKKLHAAGTELLSTGGTAKAIADAGIPVTDVSEITKFQECLDGRVKTLHPAVHAGILARTSYKKDNDELEALGIKPIELVVVNLYPFEQKVQDPATTPAVATEFIDIGGPTMIRAAAKNFAHVCILSNPGQYASFLDEMDSEGGISFGTRKKLAGDAFNHTAGYDAAIAGYFQNLQGHTLPERINLSMPLAHELRYGENPHQQAAVYGNPDAFIDCFHGKQLSYNNYLDVDAAILIISAFETKKPVCAIIKHTIPCGLGMADTLSEAYKKAFSTDTVSPFGGIVVVNKELDIETAGEIDKIFTEIIIAPSFSKEALALLTQKKNRRLIVLKQDYSRTKNITYKSVFGGLLAQEADTENTDTAQLKVVTKRSPDKQEMEDLLFAWKVVRNIKSNGIVYARNGQTLGIGSGQTSRIDSAEIAARNAAKENLSLTGSAMASDAFFPFADGIEAAAKAGATAVIQPGGSIRDEEVIAKADEYNMAMIFTGKRHFRH